MFFFCFLQLRWNDSWACKSSVHGWDFNWFRQLHNISDSQVFEAVSACSGQHIDCLSFAASTWNFWALWWSHLAVRRPGCLPRSKGLGAWFLPLNGLQVPWAERSCRFLTGGGWRSVLFVEQNFVSDIAGSSMTQYRIVMVQYAQQPPSTSIPVFG